MDNSEFVMTRGKYWACSAALLLAAFSFGFLASDPYGNLAAGEDLFVRLIGLVGMWTIGFMRLRDAGCKHTWPAIFAPSIIGLIWIGCIGDRVTECTFDEI